MLKKIGKYLFKRPDEIGLDNYLVLVFCFLAAILCILGTLINVGLNLGWFITTFTLVSGCIFIFLYLYSWNKKKYAVSKYFLIFLSQILLNFQWFLNYGSSGPILYLFIVLESFIIIFFKKLEKFILTVVVFINVTALFYVEYLDPALIGKYANDSIRILDIYWGLVIYLLLSILLLNIALRFYIRQQEKAQLADKLKSAFLANMSHEIRTPMNGILGFAELLKEPNLSGQEQKEFIGIIEKSGKRMLNIINDIIDISKIEAGLMMVDLAAADINEQVDYVYTFFKPETEKKGIKLSIKKSLPSDEAVIKTDHEKLYAILINLVKNAIKYTSEGSIEFGYNKKVDHDSVVLEFYVKDTGIGIPKDMHEAIFERFIQADITDKNAYQGAGLGLAISKAYVEMMGGKIRVESGHDKGATFYFTIPYNTESGELYVPQKTSPCGEGIEQINKLKILIVEDDAASDMLITREIRSCTREIIKAGTGVAAIEACRNNRDIDLIFMDIQMPEMDGYEATREIRKFNKDVVIIAQTAFALSGDREKSLEAGCNDYISKPIHNGAILKLIREHFT